MYKIFLNIEAEENNVSVLHNIVLAFASYKTFFLSGHHIAAALVYKLVKADNLGTDKAALKV